MIFLFFPVLIIFTVEIQKNLPMLHHLFRQIIIQGTYLYHYDLKQLFEFLEEVQACLRSSVSAQYLRFLIFLSDFGNDFSVSLQIMCLR